MTFKFQGKLGMNEVRCLRRNLLLEALEKELPHGTIRLGAKVVSIEDAGDLKLLHLEDGCTIKTKALVGCDGVNSVVAKWLGLKKPNFAGRSATRGIVEFPDGHNFKPLFLQYFGDGFRSGFLACDDKHVYWFFTWSPSPQDKEVVKSPSKTKQFVLSKLGKVPADVAEVVEKTDVDDILSSDLRFRSPFELLWGPIYKGNVCLAGDAFHAMTPDLGQGGCSALEDGVVLSRSLAEALLEKSSGKSEHERIEQGVEKYVKEKKWRCFKLVPTAYIMGQIQQSGGASMNFNEG